MPFAVQRAQPKINVAPLIDVLLVMIIIFMAVDPKPARRHEARIPTTSLSSPPARVSPLVICIARTGELSLNGRSIASHELALNLKKLMHEQSPSVHTVFIKGTAEIPYAFVTQVIDMVKSVGAVAPLALQIDDLPAT